MAEIKSNSGSPGERDTRERILDAAEREFAGQGFGSTSLRTITQAAGVNLAAVNYHFGSKDALTHEVITRRLAPMNRERLALLDRLEEEAGADGPPLDRIVEAFVAPPLRSARTWEPVVMGLLAHAMHQPSESMRELFYEEFREVADRFVRAFNRARPELSQQEVYWRLTFMVGSLIHSMSMKHHMARYCAALEDLDDVDSVLHRMVPFLAAGFSAPMPTGEKEA